MHLDLLSAGAAQGLVNALAARFATQTGCQIAGTFGAVGAMRDQLLAGAPADLLILTQALITGLAGTGHIVPGSVADIGVVRTALAVRCGDALPAVADRDGLRAALVAADGIYFPDPRHATAGMHFAKVLRALGMGEGPHLRAFANGATAMREMAAAARGDRVIGCTQATEIVATPGVTLAGSLPGEFELATTYSLGVCARASLPRDAHRFAAMLTSKANGEARERAGFERTP
jgi:molybdate transport system substrate-binding protein